ncbi:MAG: hypothetical protein L0H23_00675 [Luteimonas sp.]|nr:hypothetical protein [Luteimonas sp.]
MTPDLIPTLKPTELRRLTRAGLLDNVERMRNDFARKLAAIKPVSFVALAASRHPDLPIAQAFVILQGDLATVVRTLEATSEAHRLAFAAEAERLAPIVAASTHRSLEIAAQLTGIASRLRSSEVADRGKRDRLRAAGLTGADLDRAAAPFDPSELHAERDALLAEQVALEAFLKTREEGHLPAGFAEASAA